MTNTLRPSTISSQMKVQTNRFLPWEVLLYIISFSVSDAWKTSMLKDEFEQKLIQVDRDEKEARKRESEKQPPRSDWGREAFSTRFSCHFCGEVGLHFEH